MKPWAFSVNRASSEASSRAAAVPAAETFKTFSPVPHYGTSFKQGHTVLPLLHTRQLPSPLIPLLKQHSTGSALPHRPSNTSPASDQQPTLLITPLCHHCKRDHSFSSSFLPISNATATAIHLFPPTWFLTLLLVTFQSNFRYVGGAQQGKVLHHSCQWCGWFDHE